MNNDDAHWHLLVNHWPILGGMLATFVLVYGLARRSSDVITLSYWLLLLVAISTGVSKQTGGAAKRRLAELGLLNETMLNAHREASDWATWAMYLTAGLAGLALAWSRTRQYRYWPVRSSPARGVPKFVRYGPPKQDNLLGLTLK